MKLVCRFISAEGVVEDYLLNYTDDEMKSLFTDEERLHLYQNIDIKRSEHYGTTHIASLTHACNSLFN